MKTQNTASAAQPAHTPGPWHFSGTGRITDNTEARNTIARIDCSDRYLYSNSPEMPNARLIAASPAMYDYIFARAATGDREAKKIIDSLTATG